MGIAFLTARGFEGTVESWTDAFGRPRVPIEVVSYEDVADGLVESLPAGMVVFTDIERLNPDATAFATALYDHIAGSSPDTVILNHPQRSLRRLGVLEALHARGNPIRAFRLNDLPNDLRYPVFLRYEDDHTGNLSPLLEDSAELDHVIVRARLRGHDLRRLIAVEFVDTSIAGEFVKYGAFIIGPNIIARSRNVSNHWVVKAPRGEWSTTTDALAHEYVRTNPHADALRSIAQATRIDYGRIDYSMRGTDVVVWEVNTNPWMFAELTAEYRKTIDRQRDVARRLGSALEAVHGPPTSERLQVPAIANAMNTAPDTTARSRIVQWARRHKAAVGPVVDIVAGALKPFESSIANRWTSRISH